MSDTIRDKAIGEILWTYGLEQLDQRHHAEFGAYEDVRDTLDSYFELGMSAEDSLDALERALRTKLLPPYDTKGLS